MASRSPKGRRIPLPPAVQARASVVPMPGSQVRAARPSALTYQLGGKQYPMRSVATCKTCQHPDRVYIERMVLRGYGPTAVWNSLSEQAQQELSVRNIGNHSREHLPVDLIVRQAIVEARAREIGLDPDSEVASLVDRLTLARVGLQKVFERMADGEIKPGFTEGIAFAQMIERAEAVGGASYDQDALSQGFMVYMAAMRQVCTPDQIRQMGAIIAEDPVMKALLQRGQQIGAVAESA